MAYFITKVDVINAAFTRDVEEAKIQDDLIESAGIRYLLPILGEDFYNAVVLTPGDYTTLKPYLIKVVANYVKYLMLPEIHMEVSTAGLNQFTGQNKQPATRAGMEGVRQSVLEIAEAQAGRLHKFLEDNSDDYSLYFSSANPQNQVTHVGGIVLDNERENLTQDDLYRLGYDY